MFRLVSALEKAGHRCIVYTVDRHAWEVGQHAAADPLVVALDRAEVRDAGGGIADAHAIFATGWETAYQALAHRAREALLSGAGLRAFVLSRWERLALG